MIIPLPFIASFCPRSFFPFIQLNAHQKSIIREDLKFVCWHCAVFPPKNTPSYLRAFVANERRVPLVHTSSPSSAIRLLPTPPPLSWSSGDFAARPLEWTKIWRELNQAIDAQNITIIAITDANCVHWLRIICLDKASVLFTLYFVYNMFLSCLQLCDYAIWLSQANVKICTKTNYKCKIPRQIYTEKAGERLACFALCNWQISVDIAYENNLIPFIWLPFLPG